MRPIYISCLVVCLLWIQVMSVPSVSVDMNPSTAGVQSNTVANDTGLTFIIDLVGQDFENLFGYQFNICFDTAKFEYLACDKDYGITGPKNLLTNNGGSVNGFCQRQQNPPAEDTVEFAYAIFEDNEALKVSGSGLIGIASFKSKMAFGDTGTINVLAGAWTEYDGTTLHVIDTYYSGLYIIPGQTGTNHNTHTIPAGIELFSRMTGSRGSLPVIHYTVPHIPGKNNVDCSIKIFDVKGQLIATLVNITVAPGSYSIEINEKISGSLSSGLLLCNMKVDNFSKAIKIWYGR